MDENSYLTQLTLRLLDGAQRLPGDLRSRHADYLRHCQNADGGFSGREGGSDLYYTAFGLRGLMVLDALTPEICDRAAGYLRHSLTQQASVVDFYSLLYGWMLVQLGGGPDVLADSARDWQDRVATLMEMFRTPDGGYARTPGNTGGSTYHSFLVALCYEILGKPIPRPEAVAAFVRARQRDDGGFVEVAPARRSGTNPTAAAVGLLQILSGGGPTPAEAERIAIFLLEMPGDDGGLRANGRVPLSDSLSTFTGLVTLRAVGALDRVHARAIREFALALQQPEGGFSGGLWDERADVEYTFYGLGCLALLT
jgi:geranylgeranyl transferase type-2 subunit beta